jgi:hypothetical protein
MRTHEKFGHSGIYEASHRRPQHRKANLPRHQGNPMPAGDGHQTLQTRLTGLVQEHRDLDGAILLLFETGACDPLLIARMKKRKLHLKDEIARLSATYESALASV